MPAAICHPRSNNLLSNPKTRTVVFLGPHPHFNYNNQPSILLKLPPPNSPRPQNFQTRRGKNANFTKPAHQSPRNRHRTHQKAQTSKKNRIFLQNYTFSHQPNPNLIYLHSNPSKAANVPQKT